MLYLNTMNLNALLLISILLRVGSLQAQSVQEVFTQKQLTWYGIDFSKAKFIGEFGKVTPSNDAQLRDEYFRSWNYVVVNEPEKYDFAKFFAKESARVDIAQIETINAGVATGNLMQVTVPPALTKEQIQAAVKKYDSKEKSGLGLVCLVEAFDKVAATGTLNLVFFDIASKHVLLIKRFQEKPSGFGLRNYWISTIYRALEDSKRNWPIWSKEAGVKPTLTEGK